ncbi:MAG TPA: hypothetical protein PK183_09535 [Bacillota bacterium]|jgi:hypothetical protein|nr:hypothetical protein [Bacillota bacterium]
MAMPSMGLFSIEDPSKKAMQGLGQAANTYAAMDKKGPEAPKKTVGGGLMSAAGMGLAGAEAAKLISTSAAAGPWGLAIGAGVGALAYFLS